MTAKTKVLALEIQKQDMMSLFNPNFVNELINIASKKAKWLIKRKQDLELACEEISFIESQILNSEQRQREKEQE